MQSEDARSDARKDELLKLLAPSFIPREKAPNLKKSGAIARWVFDFRPLTLSAKVLDSVSELFWRQLKDENIAVVGGLETASIPLIAGLLLKAKENGALLRGFYIRKSRRKDGFQKIIEGSVGDGRIVLVDDVMNSGKSFLRQIVALEAEGKKVHAICCIVRYREFSYYTFFHERGIRIISLFTLDDFPQSGGIAGLNAAAAQMSVASPRAHYTVIWKFKSENPSFFYVVPKSAPVIDKEHLYVGADNGALWALKQSDGSVVWSFRTLFGAGKGAIQKRIFSSPVLSQDLVIFGAYDGNLYALDKQTGAKKWIYMEADWIGSSPCVAENLGLVFIGLEFGLWKKRGGLAALKVETGEKVWWHQGESLTHSSPAYSTAYNTVVVGSENGTVFAFNASSGQLRWTYQTGGPIKASFSFDEANGYVCFGSFDHNIHVLDTLTGKLVHKIETLESLYANPLVHDGKLFMGGLDKCVYCIDLATGQVTWTHWTHGRIFASPIVINGHVYIGSNDGRLYELDSETGREASFFQVNERIVNAIAYNPISKRFFLPTHGNEVYCLEKASPPVNSENT